MTHEEFIASIWEKVKKYPKEHRPGQKVFNACEELYGSVARDVQFNDMIDCYYDNTQIEDFIEAVWKRLHEKDVDYKKLLDLLIEAIDYSFMRPDGDYNLELTYPVIDKVKYIKKSLHTNDVFFKT